MPSVLREVCSIRKAGRRFLAIELPGQKRNRMMKIKAIPWAALAVALAVGGCAANESAKPNIVFILMDDMGYGDIGAVQSQDKEPYTKP